MLVNYAVLKVVAIIGAIFSILAGLLAYLITYQEYVRHYPDKGIPRKIALQAAVTAFFFFLVLSIIGGLLFARFA
ncbi:MAG: hypothetical protein CO189_06115 [candidate division Zixibacteria bacterium CG_4_9_14_3_um_filter_46_8]|nr:MAG: hypothetical protein CO189_06115 [candidate division Zixibacteria bacterium CG_4_9_14_3_um_filter_46_8]